MTDNANTGGGRGSTGLAFIVGGLVVAVLVIGFFVFGGAFEGADKDVNIKVQPPEIGGSDTSSGGGNASGGGSAGEGQGQ